MALVKSQCCLRGDVSLLETTELLTKLPPADLLNIMSCKVTLIFFNCSLTSQYINVLYHIDQLKCDFIASDPGLCSTAGVQPKPAVSMPEYGDAAVCPGSGVPLVRDSLAGDPRAARGGHRVTSCPAPVLPAARPATALLETTS